MDNIEVTITEEHIDVTIADAIIEGRGPTGAQGEKGEKGDPGTTDYNELENLPDLTLKADKATTYTKTEVDTALAGKANTVHTHVASDVTDFNSSVSSNSDVSANTTARHTHANKPILDATTASFTTASETKLSGIAAGATQNASDAALRDRSTHTGTQPISTVAGLQTALDGKATAAQGALADTALQSETDPTVPAWAKQPTKPSYTKTEVGLDNVDNTSDADKPVSTAQQTALGGKADFPASNQRVPVRNSTGSQASEAYSPTPSAYSLVQRTSTGTARGATAVANDDLVPKAQMDAADALKVNKAGDTMTGLLQSVTSTLGYSAQRSGTRFDFGVDSGGNFTVYNNTGTVASSTYSDGSGIAFAGKMIKYGTGFPNGVVGAPVGSIYIDTAVTNGASSWIKKSGAGNTGWSVLEGDTGWRNITSSLTNGWTASVVRVRRIGSLVVWGLEALNASAMTNIAFLTPSAGFQPSGLNGNPDRQFLTTAANPAAVWRVTLNTTGFAVQGAPNSLQLTYGTLNSSTIDDWPSTLPGTAL